MRFRYDASTDYADYTDEKIDGYFVFQSNAYAADWTVDHDPWFTTADEN